jgi:hypothetical protein
VRIDNNNNLSIKIITKKNALWTKKVLRVKRNVKHLEIAGLCHSPLISSEDSALLNTIFFACKLNLLNCLRFFPVYCRLPSIDEDVQMCKEKKKFFFAVDSNGR